MIKKDEFSLESSSQPVIHRGPWVVAELTPDAHGVGQRIIEDGALLVDNGFIKAVGKFQDISQEFAGCSVQDHQDRVLTPALINSHSHLELSHLDLSGSINDTSCYGEDPTSWIRDLLSAKETFLQSSPDAEEKILHHARQSLDDMHLQGVAFVGDIGNSLASRVIGKEHKTTVFFLLELLGLSRESESKAIARLEEISADSDIEICCTAHAPYSTTPALIQTIKSRADKRGHVFSIHVAESRPEVEFLQAGSGQLLDFLHERGAWDSTFTIPGMGSVQYLDSLGVLNDSTLCVHVVHVEQSEIAILAKRKANICLCPGSNRFLGVGKAPVTEFLAHGILPALGTDSKASNGVLSMWNEMCFLRQDHPGLTPEAVFCMATRGGAEAWGLASELGTLAPGKQALILAIDCRDNMGSGSQIMEYLTTAGESVSVGWVE